MTKTLNYFSVYESTAKQSSIVIKEIEERIGILRYRTSWRTERKCTDHRKRKRKRGKERREGVTERYR